MIFLPYENKSLKHPALIFQSDLSSHSQLLTAEPELLGFCSWPWEQLAIKLKGEVRMPWSIHKQGGLDKVLHLFKQNEKPSLDGAQPLLHLQERVAFPCP